MDDQKLVDMNWVVQMVPKLNLPATGRMVNPRDGNKLYEAMNIQSASFHTPMGTAVMAAYAIGPEPATKEPLGLVVMGLPGGGRHFQIADSIQGCDLHAAANKLVEGLPAFFAGQEEDEQHGYFVLVHELLNKHYGLSANDMGLTLGSEQLSELSAQGVEPYELVNEHAEKNSLDRIDSDEFFPKGPLTISDQQALREQLSQHFPAPGAVSRLQPGLK